MTTPNDQVKKEPGTRKRNFAIVFILLLVTAAGCLAWYMLYARYYETTDDAYVNGNQVTLTPQINGTVTQVSADEGDYVEKGQPLVQLDPSDTQIALQQAEASLANTVRQVRGLYSTADNYRAQVVAKQVALQTAQSDYARRQKIFSTGAIAAEDLSHYRDAVTSARSDLVAAQQALRTNLAMVDDTVIDSHPEIKSAVATLRQRYLDHARSTIVAPVSGFIARRAVQLGMRVESGATMMSIVPLDQVWVDANFKESQMKSMRLGQQVTLSSDLYGENVEYHGVIESLGIGTGSAFSLLPAQNASGNWIKIVQRLPVRIRLSPHDMQKYPLRIGLSMVARVDIRDNEGQLLPQKTVATPRFTTDVYQNALENADRLVSKILHDNGPVLSSDSRQEGSDAR
ncbi:efflux RND transporter periplasmic adaptor subunit [Enterobacter sp. UPMP2060]